MAILKLQKDKCLNLEVRNGRSDSASVSLPAQNILSYLLQPTESLTIKIKELMRGSHGNRTARQILLKELKTSGYITHIGLAVVIHDESRNIKKHKISNISERCINGKHRKSKTAKSITSSFISLQNNALPDGNDKTSQISSLPNDSSDDIKYVIKSIVSVAHDRSKSHSQ